MPASEINFPSELAARQDSKYFKVSLADKTIRGSMEGGYEHTRPRYTRKHRRTFSTGFTDISQEELDALLAFYDLVGGYKVFNWKNPANGEVYAVRFDQPPEATYTGIGGNHRYDVTNINLSEA